MDYEGLFVLGFFMIVVGIPVIGAFAVKIHKQRIALQERELELVGQQTAEKAAQYASRTQELEQRVRVLEQIVTDGGIETAAQIEALRGTPQPVEEKKVQ